MNLNPKNKKNIVYCDISPIEALKVVQVINSMENLKFSIIDGVTKVSTKSKIYNYVTQKESYKELGVYSILHLKGISNIKTAAKRILAFVDVNIITTLFVNHTTKKIGICRISKLYLSYCRHTRYSPVSFRRILDEISKNQKLIS